MSKHMHPFLQAEDESPSSGTGTDGVDKGVSHGNVLTRIDASKLHGALSNATQMGTMEVR